MTRRSAAFGRGTLPGGSDRSVRGIRAYESWLVVIEIKIVCWGGIAGTYRNRSEAKVLSNHTAGGRRAEIKESPSRTIAGNKQLRQQNIESCVCFALITAISLIIGGCSRDANYAVGPSGQHGTIQQPPSSVSPMQTNLYGELGGWKPVAFDAKPFASLIQHSFCEEGGDFDPDAGPDGSWIVFSSVRHSPNPDLYIKKTYGATATRLTSDPASEIQPSFSPNGDTVAYASNRSGSWDIWLTGIDGTNPIRLTTGLSNDIHPSFSPDGKYLAYCSFGPRSQQWELWILDIERPSIKKWVSYGLFPEWSPNPEVPKIAFQLARARGSQWFSVWTMDFIDGEAKYPTEIVSSIDYACICPGWSADAGKIVYSTVAKATYEPSGQQPIPSITGEDIWMIDLDGRNNQRLTQGDASNYSPNFSPDGRILFCSDRSSTDNIWSLKPHGIDFKVDTPMDLSKHPQGGIWAN